jgi:signal transduction histidine kinase
MDAARRTTTQFTPASLAALGAIERRHRELAAELGVDANTALAQLDAQKPVHYAPNLNEIEALADCAIVDSSHASNGHSLGAQLEELAYAARRRDELLAMLSHELRSPLASIQHAITILRGPSADVAVQRGMHELIQRQVRQMTLVVSSLFDVSSSSRGQLQLQRQRVDLRTVLSNAIETLESEFSQRRQHPVIIWPDQSLWILADPHRLEQVFVNLLSNASKYTAEGGKIGLSLQARDGFTLVRIRDSGVGIAANELPHIFDLFVRSDAAAVRSRSGLGIGLALVRTIVDLHGGTVSAASSGLGLGSEFTVRLPEDR